MLELYKNIKKRRQELGLSQQKLAELVGYSDKSMIAHVEKGDVDLTQSKILLFAKALQIPAGDLMGWDGVVDAPEEPEINYQIPVYESVAAGPGRMMIDQPVDYINYESPNSGELFAVQVKGNSMSPMIMDGDTVIVRSQPTINSGEIAVVAINGDEATIKQVFISEAGITLVALNPEVYSPHFYTNDEIASLPITIKGKVIEQRRSIN